METTILETTAAVAETAGGIGFTPENLAQTAPIMGKGMIGIFIVMGIIILTVAILNHATAPKKPKENK